MPQTDAELPDIADRLVEPETRYEMLDGELVYVPPAEPPQGRRCAQLATLLVAHTGVEFEVCISALIRTSQIDDFASHLTVWPRRPGSQDRRPAAPAARDRDRQHRVARPLRPEGRPTAMHS